MRYGSLGERAPPEKCKFVPREISYTLKISYTKARVRGMNLVLAG